LTTCFRHSKIFVFSKGWAWITSS